MNEQSTALARREMIRAVAVPTDSEINRQWRMAEALQRANVYPDVTDAHKAFATILMGHDLGLSPTQALSGVHLVKGRPQVGATLLAGFIKRTPGYDYKIVKHDEDECSIDFLIDGESVGISTFSMDDAVKAKLAVKNADGSYKAADKASEGWAKYPRNMLFARALSNGIKWFMPDATGGIAVYAEGELPPEPVLTSGTGDGSAPGVDLGRNVEKVIARAQKLGHEGFSDRAAIEVALGKRGPDVAAKWARDAEEALDRFEAESITDAVVVTPAEQAAGKREAAEALDREADAEAVSDEARAGSMREAAEKLRAEAVELEAGGDDGE